jgi:hypothetical protein
LPLLQNAIDMIRLHELPPFYLHMKIDNWTPHTLIDKLTCI